MEQHQMTGNTDFSIKETLLDVHQFIPVSDAAYAPLDGLAPGSAEAQARQREVAKRLNLPLEIKTKVTGIRFRLIPPGMFLMGSPENEKGRGVDERLHRVTITQPFYMGVFEVTQAQWERVTGTNPSHFQTIDGNLPVESVSWNDCKTFCEKLCELESVPNGTFDLPTEAQWEYACRAGTQTPYYFGHKIDHTMANIAHKPLFNRIVDLFVEVFLSNWLVKFVFGYIPKPEGALHPVGQYKPNAFGLYDMHGNVSEWCSDKANADNCDCGTGIELYDEEDLLILVQREAVLDIFKRYEEARLPRIARGGSWRDKPRACRAARRRIGISHTGSKVVGLRLVMEIAEQR